MACFSFALHYERRVIALNANAVLIIRRGLRVLLLAFTGFLSATTLAQQTLVCPPTTSGASCDTFHYHVAMYSPDKKNFAEITGANQFATQASCDRARDAQLAANAKVVDFFRTVKKQQYEADRFGPCHCDRTIDRASPTYLDAALRSMQLRNAEEIRLRVRERLLDEKLPTDSEVVRSLNADLPSTPLLGAPKFVALPPSVPVQVVTSADDLAATKTIDAPKPTVVAANLPLAEIGNVPAQIAADPPVREEVVNPETRVEPPSDEDLLSAQETAERFIGYETQRIDNILKASSAIADETVKAKIFEACMQRIQLLSNLRLLIEGSGMKSKLTAAARDAQTEPQRLELIGRLFGAAAAKHWAPSDAADVIFVIENEIAAAPERVLRDTAGQFTIAQKKRALYSLLVQTQPTEEQRLWLSTIVEGFLR
ncbi:MAG: hypothetical protein ACTHQM_07125 [Thermoanaerobaculia bacterium]